jgi:hypothetical protein
LRLLKDVRPAWFVVASGVLLTLGALDGAWLYSPATWAGSLWFSGAVWAFLPSAPYLSKFRTWRVLPVSRLGRRQAQAWVALGLPLSWILLAMALALAIHAVVGGPQAAPPEIAKALGIQMLAMTAMAAIAVGVAQARRLSLGALRAAAKPGARNPAPGFPGWPALSPLVLASLAMAAASGVAVGFWPPSPGEPGPAGTASALPSQSLVIVLVIWAIGGSTPVRSVRALRALPIGALGLTAVLQGFVLAVGACAFAGLWTVYTVRGAETDRLATLAWAAIPILSLRLPLDFRFGGPKVLWLTIAPIVLITLARLIPPAAQPTAGIAGLGLAALAWGWTWRELSSGRGAYRAQPVRPARWRGA